VGILRHGGPLLVELLGGCPTPTTRQASGGDRHLNLHENQDNLHAYAVSIHRSQGSEYPCVVVALTMSAWLMLQRNLLYTAVTRAKQLVVLVGSRRALAKAVRTQGAGRRYTALTQRLQPEPGRAGSG
jgi:exodeoxyribonuclease V alpha subunit